MISSISQSKKQELFSVHEYPIFIKDLTGRSTLVQVSSEEKVSQLKEKVFLFQGIPQQSQRLVFSGKDLQNQQTLLESEVSKDSEVSLLLHLRGGMRVYVLDSKFKYQLNADPRDTVLSLKKLITKGINIPLDNYRLLFVDQLLKDDCTLEDYHIGPDAVIKLVYYFSSCCKWEIQAKGLNYEAICNTPSCDAYQKKVWIQKGFGRFDVLSDIFNGVFCPICNKPTADPDNIGLVGCLAEVDGKMVKPERKIVCKTLEVASKESISLGEGGKNWVELIVNVTRA